jgi:hypothetical protein
MFPFPSETPHFASREFPGFPGLRQLNWRKIGAEPQTPD